MCHLYSTHYTVEHLEIAIFSFKFTSPSHYDEAYTNTVDSIKKTRNALTVPAFIIFC